MDDTYEYLPAQTASDVVCSLVIFDEQVESDYNEKIHTGTAVLVGWLVGRTDETVRAVSYPKHIDRIEGGKAMSRTKGLNVSVTNQDQISDLGKKLWAIRNEIMKDGIGIINSLEELDAEMRRIRSSTSEEI